MRGWKTKLCKLEEGFPVDELIQKKKCPVFNTWRKTWEEKIGIYLHYIYRNQAGK